MDCQKNYRVKSISGGPCRTDTGIGLGDPKN